MLILYKRSHVEYHGRFTARFLKRIQLGSPGLKTGLDIILPHFIMALLGRVKIFKLIYENVY